MPAGIQFGNLNNYRRYPFADDSAQDCLIAYRGRSGRISRINTQLPPTLIQAIRFVYVGVNSISAVFLSRFEAHDSDGRIRYSFGFTLVGSDGGPIPFFCKGAKFFTDESGGQAGFNPNYRDSVLNLSVRESSVARPKTYIWSASDFDFSNCISVCLKTDLGSVLSCIRDISSLIPLDKFSLQCNIPLAPHTILSMRSPHVMSLSDDSGELIRDQDTVSLVAGFNTKFDAAPGTNSLIISALPSAGEGKANCQSGLSSMFSGSVVRKMNGISVSPTGNISLTGGHGVVVTPVEGTNIINIYSDLENKDSMECKMS